MIPTSKCYIRKCKHFRGAVRPDGTEGSERVVCAAFPDMIPNEIAYGINEHSEVHPDQENDITYERKEE